MRSKIIFSRNQRLTSKKDISRMFKDGTRCTSGPLLFHKCKNELGFPRLGLSVPKRVGNAVFRNTMKRRCREAFRQSQKQLPSVDILLTIRPHALLETYEYAALILKAVAT